MKETLEVLDKALQKLQGLAKDGAGSSNFSRRRNAERLYSVAFQKAVGLGLISQIRKKYR